jgi:acetyl-CoA acetyltransferase
VAVFAGDQQEPPRREEVLDRVAVAVIAIDPGVRQRGTRVVAGPDPSLLSQPSNAIKKALDREGLGVDQVDLFEINEAFASVTIQSMRDLGIDSDVVNVNGGAIAMGHPIGVSGARIVLHLGYRTAPPRRRHRRRGPPRRRRAG